MRLIPPILPPLKRIKWYLLTILLLLIIKIPWTYYSYESGSQILEGNNRADVIARTAFLVERVVNQSAGTEDMPSTIGSQFQGEWALVTYSMLAAALTNSSVRWPETKTTSIAVVKDLIELTLQESTRRFDTLRWGEDPLDSLAGENGHIGYLGHLNFILSAYKALKGAGYDKLFSTISESLARRLRNAGGKCLATYPYENRYSADNAVVVASLANYSKLHQGKLKEIVTTWVQHAKVHASEQTTGLMPFRYDSDCHPLDHGRGSGTGWNSFYLGYIDVDFAKEQYRLLKKEFRQHWIIGGVREYRRGVWGIGDVDSGPVIFGLSPSGTGFTVGGATFHKDADFLSELMFTAELVGTTAEWGGRRSYLLAPLVGEAIMLAMKTAIPWDQLLSK